ncbi:MAG: hypothetical protein QW404_03375, partial [Candidatus Nanoarchaeia archaeon]
MEGDNSKDVEPSKDMLLAYMRGEDCHFFLEFVKGVGVLRVENDSGRTLGHMILGNKRSIDLLEQRLLFLKRLMYKNNNSSTGDVVDDLLSEQEFVGG